MKTRRILGTSLTVALLLAVLWADGVAQTTSTQPATQGGGRGRGARGVGRGPTTNPSMVQDPATAQWYTPMQHAEYGFGADMSSTKQLEEQGKVFKDTDGQPKPALQLFKDHGYNWVRLRTCVEPARLPQTTEYAIDLSQKARKLGFKLLLDFHYSNSWADPTNEPTPTNWQNLTHTERVNAVYEYTRDTIGAMSKAGTLPDIIQVGNEVSNGFMWPNGKLPENWGQFADYVYAGVNGIDAGRGNGKRPRIMIHVDHGGDIPKTRAFFDKFNTYNIPYDMIGFSFYPWSHGTLMDLKANFEFTANTYHKEIMLVETGYYYRPSQYFGKTPGPFPETPEGQAQWLDAVNKIVMDTPGGLGKGVFWWEPASNGGLVARGYFDADGNVQPIINVFHAYTRPAHRTDNQ